MPASVAATPPVSVQAAPIRPTTRLITTATAKLTAVIGRNARPAWSGVKPSTPCRDWGGKKKKPIIAPGDSNRAGGAPGGTPARRLGSQIAVGGQQHGQADRHVEEEAGPPGDPVGQHPADDQAGTGP